ncbi:hypothetical protein BaRGS_00033339 [Batillaria attramentaria]|uniref:Secreted protein n=1 Tax=Batillaria attramentaria TaxID=370345 RepID=A0ABD0JKN4_9CAEN
MQTRLLLTVLVMVLLLVTYLCCQVEAGRGDRASRRNRQQRNRHSQRPGGRGRNRQTMKDTAPTDDHDLTVSTAVVRRTCWIQRFRGLRLSDFCYTLAQGHQSQRVSSDREESKGNKRTMMMTTRQDLVLAATGILTFLLILPSVPGNAPEDFHQQGAPSDPDIHKPPSVQLRLLFLRLLCQDVETSNLAARDFCYDGQSASTRHVSERTDA